jgi:hypothetical protein
MSTRSQASSVLKRLGAGYFVGVALALSPTTLAGEPNAAGRAWQALSKDWLNAEDRQTASTAIAEFCKTFANAVPTLSPREQDWLDAELASDRVFAATGSLEFSKRVAGERARGCFKYAMNLSSPEAVTAMVATRHELLIWSLLAWELSEPDFQYHLARLVQSQSVVLQKDEIEMSRVGPTMARLILRNVLIPPLNQR